MRPSHERDQAVQGCCSIISVHSAVSTEFLFFYVACDRMRLILSRVPFRLYNVYTFVKNYVERQTALSNVHRRLCIA